MAYEQIPEIRDLPASELAVTGQSVHVGVHYEHPQLGPCQQSSDELIRDSVDEMFRQEGISPSRDLNRLCALAARISVAKLVLSEGFTVEIGGDRLSGRNPREVIEVNLRQKDSVSRTAEVKSQSSQ